MASNPLMAFTLIGLGLRQLSVAPRSVAVVKQIVRGVHVARAHEAAERALAAATAEEAEAILTAALHAELGGSPGRPHAITDSASAPHG
jgi:signal transduction protein with GAF and PtsI domain